MQFLYKDGGKLIYDIGTIEIFDDNDPDVELFNSGKYKEFLFTLKTQTLSGKIYFKKSLFSSKIIAEDITYVEGLYFAYVDNLEGKPAEILYDNIDFFVNHPQNIILLPHFPKVDVKSELNKIPYFIMYSRQNDMYFFEHGLFTEMYYDSASATAVISSYTNIISIKIPPAQFPALIESIANAKTTLPIKNEFHGKLIETNLSFTRDVSALNKIIELPFVLALVEDEEGEYYFKIYDSKHNKIVKYYTNPKNASVWRVEVDGNYADLDMQYIDFYEYLIKNFDEGQNRALTV